MRRLACYGIALGELVLLTLVELIDVGSGKFASADTLGEEDIEFMESTILCVVRSRQTTRTKILTLVSGSLK